MSLTLERLKSQIRQVQHVPIVVTPIIKPTIVHPIDAPVSLDELRAMLEEALLDKQEKIVVNIAPLEEVRFPNIYVFVEWYEKNKEQFTAGQQTALNTLVQTRQMIEAGCACKRAGREYAAGEYFKTFWVNNLLTDMMPTLLKALNTKKVYLSDGILYPPLHS